MLEWFGTSVPCEEVLSRLDEDFELVDDCSS
jgi:hypothetical protein